MKDHLKITPTNSIYSHHEPYESGQRPDNQPHQVLLFCPVPAVVVGDTEGLSGCAWDCKGGCSSYWDTTAFCEFETSHYMHGVLRGVSLTRRWPCAQDIPRVFYVPSSSQHTLASSSKRRPAAAQSRKSPEEVLEESTRPSGARHPSRTLIHLGLDRRAASAACGAAGGALATGACAGYDRRCHDSSSGTEGLAGLARTTQESLLVREVCREATDKAGSFKPDAIVRTLQALHRLGYDAEASYQQALTKALCREARKRARTFAYKEVKTLLEVLADLNDKKGKVPLFRKIGEQLLAKRQSVKGQDIPSILHAYVRLDGRPGKKLLEEMCDQAVRKVQDLEAADMATLLKTLAALGYTPDKNVLRTLSREALRKVADFKVHEIAVFLSSLEFFGYKPRHEVLRGFCASVCTQQQDLRPTMAADVLHALSTLDFLPDMQLIQAACVTLDKANTNVHSSVRVLVAFSKLGVRPRDELLRPLCEEIASKADSLSAAECQAALAALAKLHFHPGEDMLFQLGEACLQSLTRKDGLGHHAGIATNLLYTFSVFNVFDESHFEDAFALIPDMPSELPAEYLRLLHWVNLQCSLERMDVTFPKELGQVCAMATEALLADQVKESAALRAICDVLRTGLGLAPVSPHCQTAVATEIALPSHMVAIEVVEPFDLLTCVDSPDTVLSGSRHLRHRLLQLDWKLVSIPRLEWDELIADQQAAYLAKKLSFVGVNIKLT
eukprot:g64514.t1